MARRARTVFEFHLMDTAQIFRESIRILLRHSTHFQSISIFLFSPLPFSLFLSHFLVHHFPAIPSSAITLLNYLFGQNEETQPIIELLSKTTVHIIISFPFCITCSLVGRATTIQAVADSYDGLALNDRRLFMKSGGLVWLKLLHTFLWEFVILLILFGAFMVSLATLPNILVLNGLCSRVLGFWAVLAVLGIPFCAVFAHVMVVGNLASVFTVLEDCYGIVALGKAKGLIRQRRQTVLMMVLFSNLGFRLLEFLFDFRLFRGICLWEGPIMVSMYSLLLVLDTIMNAVLYHTCKP